MKAYFSKLKSFFRKNTAFNIAFLYLCFSAIWVVFSDEILLWYFKEASILTRFQMLKAGGFILITALLVYFLLRQKIERLKQSEDRLLLYRTHLEELVQQRTLSLKEEILQRQGAEKRFRDLLEGAPDAMALVDDKGRIVLVNRQTERLFEFGREEMLGRNIEMLIPERFRERHRGHVQDFFASHRARPMGVRLDIYGLRKDGLEFPADISLSPLETKEGVFVLADIRNISERKKTEEKIKKSYHFENAINSILTISLEPLSLEDQMARILDAILAIPLLSLQQTGSIYLVEDEPEMLVLQAQRGYDKTVLAECSRVPFGTCLCGEAAEISNAVFADCLAECHKCYLGIFPHSHYIIPIASGGKVLGVLNLVLKHKHRRDKQEEDFLSSAAATLAGIIVRRKTEMEKELLQKQLVESEKLSALGRMMAGVAHEIRNPLTALGGLTRRLDKIIPAHTREKVYTSVIISESARLERILKSVLTYTRELSPQRQENDLHEIIDECLHALGKTIQDRAIMIEKSFTAVSHILIAREDAREVFDNLLSNALSAAPKGGIISIDTATEHFEQKNYATVRITDSGAGIPADKLDLIFEPFFTTKPVGPGHGIGLGLSIARKIMEEYGGQIKVESRSGQGTTFSLFFPVP